MWQQIQLLSSQLLENEHHNHTTKQQLDQQLKGLRLAAGLQFSANNPPVLHSPQ